MDGGPQGPFPQNAIGVGLQVVAGRPVVVLRLGEMQTVIDPATAIALGVQLIMNGSGGQQSPKALRELANQLETGLIVVPSIPKILG
jgi:hypothetical protein